MTFFFKSITIVVLCLFSQITFSRIVGIQSSNNSFASIKSARAFLSQIAEKNILLLDIITDEDYYAFRFEGSENSIRINKRLIASYILDQNSWRAYLTYSDTTKQEIPYLGTNGISKVNYTLNPYKICPLVAILDIDLLSPGKIKLTIAGRDEKSFNLTHTFPDVALSHRKVPVYGLYEGFLNKVVITVLGPSNNIRSEEVVLIQTDPLPWGRIKVSKNLYSDNQNHFFLMHMYVYDQQGYLRWRKVAADPQAEALLEVFPLTGGLWMSQYDAEGTTKVGMWTYLGELVRNYTIPNGFHHEMIEKTPGGNLFFGTNSQVGYEDCAIEVDRETGEIVRTWYMADYVDINRPTNWYVRRSTGIDWFHLNSIRYDPSDDTLLISARHQCLIMKIGYTDNKLKWILGNHTDWTEEYYPYLLKPLNFNTTLSPDQDWTYLQHTALFLPNGNIISFDNGASRPGFNNNPSYDLWLLLNLTYVEVEYSKYEGLPSGYVRAVEFKVDPETMTVEKIWEGTDFPTLVSSFIGSVYPIDDDFILIGYGEFQTFSVFNKKTKESIFMAHLPMMFYRASPIDFYNPSTTQKDCSGTNDNQIVC